MLHVIFPEIRGPAMFIARPAAGSETASNTLQSIAAGVTQHLPVCDAQVLPNNGIHRVGVLRTACNLSEL